MLADIRAFVDERREQVLPKTPLGRALGCLHRQWPRLILFRDDDNIELTNNRLERELRPVVLGRKNWLFTWMDSGGERTAAILTSKISPDVRAGWVTEQPRLKNPLPLLSAVQPLLDEVSIVAASVAAETPWAEQN